MNAVRVSVNGVFVNGHPRGQGGAKTGLGQSKPPETKQPDNRLGDMTRDIVFVARQPKTKRSASAITLDPVTLALRPNRRGNPRERKEGDREGWVGSI